MKLKEMKLSFFEKNKKYNFLFPIGATEQHGPFIPFGTDTYITDYLVNIIDKAIPDIIILPTLEVSRSREHRGFYGTLRLEEDTFEKVMLDICNSIKENANNIFIYSFHANSKYIERFIKKYSFDNVKIININESDDSDCDKIEKYILDGELDGHAGNSEISNILYIDENLVTLPEKNYQKKYIDNARDTDNLIDKSTNGIVDNHPLRITNKKVGKEILDIYADKVVKNIKLHL